MTPEFDLLWPKLFSLIEIEATFEAAEGHHLHACDIFSSACDKLRLNPSMTSNHVLYHILKIARPDTFNTFTLKALSSTEPPKEKEGK